MSQDIEKLRKELGFLEESLAAGIISREEYITAKSRVNEKIAELAKEDSTPPTQPSSNPAMTAPKNKSKNIEVYYSENKSSPEHSATKPTEHTHPKTEAEPMKKSTMVVLAAIAIIIIVIFLTPQNKSPTTPGPQTGVIEEKLPECSYDLDCQREGQVGTCLNPGNVDAQCRYEEAVPIEITVLTSSSCAICDPDRMKNTLKMFYPQAEFKETDIEDSNDLVQELNIVALPAYIFTEKVTQTKRYNSASASTKSTLNPVGDYYVLKPTASGAVYFFDMPKTPNTITLYILPTSITSQKAYQNLVTLANDLDFNIDIKYYSKNQDKEILRQLCIKDLYQDSFLPYLDCFFQNVNDENPSSICIEKQGLKQSAIAVCMENSANGLLDDSNKDAEKFFINTLPVFIFNNQYKQGGSLSVDILEKTFCKINKNKCET